MALTFVSGWIRFTPCLLMTINSVSGKFCSVVCCKNGKHFLTKQNKGICLNTFHNLGMTFWSVIIESQSLEGSSTFKFRDHFQLLDNRPTRQMICCQTITFSFQRLNYHKIIGSLHWLSMLQSGNWTAFHYTTLKDSYIFCCLVHVKTQDTSFPIKKMYSYNIILNKKN